MIFVRSLQEQERQQLKRLARREVGRVSERIRMILLSSRGYTVPQIAAIFWAEDHQRPRGVGGDQAELPRTVPVPPLPDSRH